MIKHKLGLSDKKFFESGEKLPSIIRQVESSSDECDIEESKSIDIQQSIQDQTL